MPYINPHYYPLFTLLDMYTLNLPAAFMFHLHNITLWSNTVAGRQRVEDECKQTGEERRPSIRSKGLSSQRPKQNHLSLQYKYYITSTLY